MRQLNTVFMGTPDFSVPCLEVLNQHPLINLVSVVSMPDRPKGRGHQLHSPEVIEYCKTQKISYFQTENINKEDVYLSKLHNIDIIIVLAFAQFLGKKVLQLPKHGCFNIHTSLLPKYRGAAPIQHALLNGDKQTGVSIQRMVKKMDAGDVCFEQKIDIHDKETGGQLYTRLKFQAALSLNEFIYQLSDNSINYTQQDESQVSFAPVIEKNDGEIIFDKMQALDIERKVRAYFPWPATSTLINKKKIKLIDVDIDQIQLAPGEVSTKNGQLRIGTQKGTVRIKRLQLPGKRPIYDHEFLNGLREDIILG